jgi:hypothetical protein
MTTSGDVSLLLRNGMQNLKNVVLKLRHMWRQITVIFPNSINIITKRRGGG